MTDEAEPDLAELYLDVAARVRVLAAEEADRLESTPVPTCPGWSAKDVVAHLAGSVEDALAGTLTGIPTDEVTAAQVESRRGRPLDDLLASWEASAPAFAEVVSSLGIWPAVIDVTTHEQDLRHALDRPGARDGAALVAGARTMAGQVRVPRRLTMTTEDGTWTRGPRDAEPLGLDTTTFELFRVLMGRRSREQLVALPWSDDPGAVVDHLCFFGPSPVAIIE